MDDEYALVVTPTGADRAVTSTASALVTAVLHPFLLTRAALLLVAWFAEQFAPSWTYADPVGATRGWQHVPELALDIWGRYDTFWYLGLAESGYRPAADLFHTQSNLAFFPLYPMLVRAAHALLPAATQGYAARFVVAIAVSNACALAGLAVVFQLVRERFRDEALARRTVLYLLLFPTGFFLSCIYSESSYLLLSASTLLFAQRGQWWRAGASALLLGLCRPAGVLVAPTLAVMYFEQRGGTSRRLSWDALAIVAAPAALALHGAHLALISKDTLAVFHAQGAWGRHLASPWTTLLQPLTTKVGPFELIGTVLFAVLGVALALQRQRALALFALLSLAPVLLSGTMMSATRFLAVVFPAFVPLAQLGRREQADRTIVVTLTFAQALFFAAWTRFYWVA